MKKIGIMGGTFNPIHNGHLFLAENAYEQIGLDQILFMPSSNPPHKTQIEMVSSEHRSKMVELAILDNPHFVLSELELNRPGMTYTADTLTILKEKEPETEYYFIEGADSLLMMTEWKNPQTIFKLSSIIVAGRDNLSREVLDKQKAYFEKTYSAKIFLLDMPAIEISSANIRERVASGRTIRYYVPDAVASYIKENGLYCREDN